MENIVIFYHISTTLGYELIVDKHLIRLKTSGLYAACNKIVVGVVSDNKDDSLSVIYALFNKHGMIDKIFFVETIGKLKEHEFHTLSALHNFVTSNPEEEYNILYFYNMPAIRGINGNILDWDNLLLYFNIDLWKSAINKISQVDLFGVNYKLKCEKYLTHFSGNYWWSKSSYLKKLDISKLESNNNQSCEMWVCSNDSHIAFCPHNSPVDHFGEFYSFDNYKIKKKITTLISYSTNDKKFLKECLMHVNSFSEETIVSFCNYYFDGSPCDINDINESIDIIIQYGAYPVLFTYDKDINPEYGKEYESRWWNNYQREQAYNAITKSTDWILWLDGDEIVDTEKFLNWVNNGDFGISDSYSLANYWYWRETNVMAEKLESNTILSKKQFITPDLFFKDPKVERENFLFRNQEHCKVGLNDDIMIHHYSWVRSKEEMIKKTQTWSHNKDGLLLQYSRNNMEMPDASWIDIIEKEYSDNIKPKSFIHGYNLTLTNRYITI